MLVKKLGEQVLDTASDSILKLMESADPEIQRTNLSLGMKKMKDFHFFDPLPQDNVVNSLNQ